MAMEIERYTDRDEKIVPERAVKNSVYGSTFKFCSQTCDDAYKEIGRTTEEIRREKA
jgi:hypothetical protein